MTGIIGCASLFLDLGMLIVGAWVLAKGSLPASLLSMLLGKGEYRASPRTARLFGSLLVVPSVALALTVVSTDAANQQAAILVSAGHLAVLLVVILTAVLWGRRIGKTAKAPE